MLNCNKCGEPYSGGVFCRKCGRRYTDDELRLFAQEQQNAAYYSGKRSSPAVLIIIILIIMFFVLSILGAILIPAFVGYMHKSRERQRQIDIQAEHYIDWNEDAGQEEIRGVSLDEYMKENNIYRDGRVYECGVDIPEGEYIVVSSDSGYGDFYFGVYTRSDCTDDNELYGGWYQGNMYVYLHEGQFVDFSHASMFRADDITISPTDNHYGAMYKVGKDIEPGTYRIKSTEEWYGCQCTVYSSIDTVIPVERFSIYDEFYEDDTEMNTFELSEGDYIRLEFGNIEKVQ